MYIMKCSNNFDIATKFNIVSSDGNRFNWPNCLITSLTLDTNTNFG